MGRLQEAEVMMSEGVEIWRKALGPEHPNVKNSMQSLEIIREKLNAA